MPCSCESECPPDSPLGRLTKSASQVIGARVTTAFAKGLADYCSSKGVSQSCAIRVALAKVAAAAGDPEQQLTAVREALGLADDADRDAIVSALDALLPAAPTDKPKPSKAPAAPIDPNASAADAPVSAQLSKEQAAACRRSGLPATARGWAIALAKSARTITAAKPAQVEASKPTTAVVCPAPFTPEQIAYGDRERIPRAELRAHLAAKAAKATRRAT